MFAQVFVQAQIKENIKVRWHGPCECDPSETGCSPRKWPITRNMFLFDDILTNNPRCRQLLQVWHRDNSCISVLHIVIWRVSPSVRFLSFSHWHVKWRKISKDFVGYFSNACWWSNKRPHLNDITWVPWRLKSPATRLLGYLLFKLTSNKTSELHISRLPNGKWWRNFFHSVTSWSAWKH